MTVSSDTGVLLVDWENLAGAIISQGFLVEAQHVEDLWDHAQQLCGGSLEAHMVAAKFDASIQEKMARCFIKEHRVASTKEHADISLTVIAMDYWHRGVRRFVLVTGDQDFIPLIERLREDNGSVTVIYGDQTRLSQVFTRMLALPGLESKSIDSISELRKRKTSFDCRDVIGLIELQRRGIILGGPDRGDRISLLKEWGILKTSDENAYWSLVESVGTKFLQPNAAVKTGNEWKAESRYRTYLKLTTERLFELSTADYLLRAMSSRREGLHVANLRSGPLAGDDGSVLDKVLQALVAVRLVRKNANGTYALIGEDLKLGYLEELWRVHAAVSAESYRGGTSTLRASRLDGLLSRGGVGQGRDNRDQARIKRAARYAAASGVIDFVGVQGERHVTATNSLLVRGFETAYAELYRLLESRLMQNIPKVEIHDMMRDYDGASERKVFGYDDRDRDRLLRVLGQSRLLKFDNDSLQLFHSDWAEALGVSRARS